MYSPFGPLLCGSTRYQPVNCQQNYRAQRCDQNGPDKSTARHTEYVLRDEPADKRTGYTNQYRYYDAARIRPRHHELRQRTGYKTDDDPHYYRSDQLSISPPPFLLLLHELMLPVLTTPADVSLHPATKLDRWCAGRSVPVTLRTKLFVTFRSSSSSRYSTVLLGTRPILRTYRANKESGPGSGNERESRAV